MLYCSESGRLDEGAEINIEIDDITAFISSPPAQALLPAAGAPRLSSVGGPLLREVQVLDEMGERRSVQVPVEQPLQVSVNGRQLVTLMTLGAKPELLVLGYLRNQRIIERLTEIESIDADLRAGGAEVVLRSAARTNDALRAGMACGLGTVFGDWMKPAEAPPPRPLRAPDSAPRISRSTLLRILEITRQYDAVHRAAGSVHGCALFHDDDLLVSVEDVSRHNGLDTVTGWMLLHGIEGADKTCFTTGRLTAEMVMKAAHNGVSIMVSRNGVTSMGHALASQLGMVLFGRAAKGRFLGYCGLERFDSDA